MMKKTWILFILPLAAILCVVCFIWLPQVIILSLNSDEFEYTTSDVADYGYITSNFDNEVAEQWIFELFPEEIEDSFQNVEYAYCARCVGKTSCEAYLEFAFDDIESFDAHIDRVTKGSETSLFFFDDSYQEYVMNDFFLLASRSDDGYSIGEAYIRKMLFDREEQRIIYVAMMISHDGIGDTAFHNIFFSRFGIDPKEYEAYTYRLKEMAEV